MKLLKPVPGRPTLRVTEKVRAKKDDFEVMIESAATNEKGKKPKKETIPTLTTPSDLKIVVDEVVKWKQTEKEAKAEMASREVQIIAWASEKQENMGFENKFSKSFYIPGNKSRVTFVTSNKWTIDPEGIGKLEHLLGDEYDEFFVEDRVVSLRPEVFSDPTLKKQLSLLIPKDKFKTFFVTDTYVRAVEDFDKKRFTLPRKIWDKMKVYVRQAKPAIK